MKKINIKSINIKNIKINGRKINSNMVIGASILLVLFVVVLVSLFYTPFDPEGMNVSLKNAKPSMTHIFGCDQFGRDTFSRVMVGIRNTFLISVATVFIGVVFGMIIGSVCGYFGGMVDEILMRINDALYAFPSVLLALVVISLLGTKTTNVMIALGIAFIPSFARMVRGEYIKQKEMDYVKKARLIGASHFRIIFVHILPNITPVLLTSVIIGFNNAVLAEAGLSYLGIGVQPPDASLGRMLSESQSLLFTNPWCAVFPGLVILLLVLGFALLSEGLSSEE